MKKEYNFFVNKQNTPNLEIYTWLLAFFYSTTGINAIIIFFNTHYVAREILLFGILFLVITPIKATDPSRENRGLFAVIGSICMHMAMTFFFAYAYSVSILYTIIIYVIEIIISIIPILIYRYRYRRTTKKRKKGNRR